MDLCRKKGIDSITINNISFKLGLEPQKRTKGKDGLAIASEPTYSEEDILAWSTTDVG